MKVSLLRLLLSVVWLQLAAVNGQSSVFLTVEGGGSDLAGPHCPGTLRLVCEGVGLTFLQWSYVYNGNAANIETIFTPGSAVPSTIPSSETGHPAFLNVTLDNVTPDPGNLAQANFTSTLTVDLGQLQNVTEIECGSIVHDNIPVNVTLFQLTAPNINSITANYQSTGLSNVDVTWEKLETLCPQFETFLHYEVKLTASVGTDLSRTISHTNCGESSCTAQFDNIFGAAVTHISLRAVNENGVSKTTIDALEQDSGQYYTPQVNIANNCTATVQCVPGASLSESTTCSVQYTTDSTYMNLSDPVMSPLNTMFQVQQLQPNTVYRFVFSVMVDERLAVNVSLETDSTDGTCGAVTVSGLGPAAIAGIVVAVLIVIVGIIIIITAAACIAKKNKVPQNLADGTPQPAINRPLFPLDPAINPPSSTPDPAIDRPLFPLDPAINPPSGENVVDSTARVAEEEGGVEHEQSIPADRKEIIELGEIEVSQQRENIPVTLEPPPQTRAVYDEPFQPPQTRAVYDEPFQPEDKPPPQNQQMKTTPNLAYGKVQPPVDDKQPPQRPVDDEQPPQPPVDDEQPPQPPVDDEQPPQQPVDNEQLPLRPVDNEQPEDQPDVEPSPKDKQMNDAGKSKTGEEAVEETVQLNKDTVFTQRLVDGHVLVSPPLDGAGTDKAMVPASYIKRQDKPGQNVLSAGQGCEGILVDTRVDGRFIENMAVVHDPDKDKHTKMDSVSVGSSTSQNSGVMFIPSTSFPTVCSSPDMTHSRKASLVINGEDRNGGQSGVSAYVLSELNILKETQKSQQQEIQEQQKESQEQKKEIKGLKMKMSQMEVTLQQQINELQDKLAERERELDAAKEEIKAIKEAREQERKMEAATREKEKHEYSVLEQRYIKEKKENDVLRQMLVDKISEQIRDLQTELTGTQKELEDYQAKDAVKEEMVAPRDDAKHESDESNNFVDQKQEKIDELKQKMTTLEGDLKNLQMSIQNKNSETKD